VILIQSSFLISKLIKREVANYGKNFMKYLYGTLRLKFFQVILVIFSLVISTITGCSNSSMENVVSKNLSFDLLEYFDGETTAWGLIVDRFGNLQRTFKVRLNGNIDNKQLLLKEYFTYNDGETEYREWIITKTETGTYEGKSKDTIGVAEGKQDRNTMRMVYDTTISIGETDIRVSFDDRFIKADKKVVINRAEILKWGIKIADVTIFFSK
jgi:hypothetical protein